MTGQLLGDCRRHRGGETLCEHYHRGYELLFLRCGAARVMVRGRTYEVREASLVFLSGLEEHAVTPIEPPDDRYYAIFDSDAADRLIGEARLMSVFRNRPDSFCHVFPAKCLPAQAVFSAWEAEAAGPGAYSDDYCAALLRQLLIAAFRRFPERFPDSGSARREIDAVRRYIDRHFTEELRVAELARSFYLDPCYLSHRFRETTGYSPKQYIMLSRISQAKELLMTTGKTVAQIAQEAGFGDVNNFIRSFRRETGWTPTQYRHPAGREA